jgi:hypothetical protein
MPEEQINLFVEPSNEKKEFVSHVDHSVTHVEVTEFDSNEEREFYHWLMELKEKGIINNIVHQPESFRLSDQRKLRIEKHLKKSSKIVDMHFVNKHIYTADYLIFWNKEYLNKVFFELDFKGIVPINFKSLFAANEDVNGEFYSYFEVKGTFDQNNMTRLFVINQKWILDIHDIYINLVIPSELFLKTFVPQKEIFSPKKKAERAKFKNADRIDDYLRKL